MTLLAKRYAAALLQVARDSVARDSDGRESVGRESDAVDAFGEDLQALHAALQEPDVRAAVASPDSSSAMRRSVLEKLVAGKHELLGNLVRVVLARRREAMLPDLWPAWRALVMAARNQAEGIVETPHPLAGDEMDRLGRLATRLSGKTVTLSSRLVPDLIGGVRLRVGNELYDGSVKNALEQLQRQLLEAPV